MRRLAGKHITGVQERKEERNILFELESVNRMESHFPLKLEHLLPHVTQEFKNECFCLLSAVKIR